MRSADHVGDVQQARRPRGDPTCLVLVVFVSHDGQCEVFRRWYISLYTSLLSGCKY